MVHLCPVVTWSYIWMVVWKSLFIVQNVRYLNGPPGPWFYHLNTGHPYCPVFRCSVLIYYLSNFRVAEIESLNFFQRMVVKVDGSWSEVWSRTSKMRNSICFEKLNSSRRIELELVLNNYLVQKNWALTINWKCVQNELVSKIYIRWSLNYQDAFTNFKSQISKRLPKLKINSWWQIPNNTGHYFKA